MKVTAKFWMFALSLALLTPTWSFAQDDVQQPTMHAPIRSGGVAVIDLPDSSAHSVSLNIVKGRFADDCAGNLTLTGSGVDFRNGTLPALKADVSNADLDNLLVDRLLLVTPAFAFDTMQLINNHTFVLSQPVTAQVAV